MSAPESNTDNAGGANKVPDDSDKLAKLFESRDGWIVSSDQGGERKLAQLGDDSTIAEGAREWLCLENNEQAKPQSDIIDLCPKLFIADLMRAEWSGTHFVFKNLKFKRVFICGTVISAYPSKDKHAIVVDDGTSHITCYLPECYDHLKDLREEVTQKKKDVTELLLENKNDPVYKLAYVMSRNSLELLQLAPSSYNDFDLGDTVSLIGNIREYSDNRYVFIKKIKKHQNGSAHLQQYLKDVFYLHEEIYK